MGADRSLPIGWAAIVAHAKRLSGIVGNALATIDIMLTIAAVVRSEGIG